MIDWKQYGPIYTVAPGIKNIEDLPVIEFDDQESRYLNLKKNLKIIFILTIYFQPNMIMPFVIR